MRIHMGEAFLEIRRRLNTLTREMLHEHFRLLYRHQSKAGVIVIAKSASEIIIESHHILLLLD
jgi:hypothetical protein